MRILYLLPILVALPALLPADGILEAPDALDWLPSWFFGQTLQAARWQWLILAAMLALSAPIAHLIRAGVTRLLEARYGRIKDSRGWDSAVGIRRSATLLVAALLWWLVLPVLELPAAHFAFVKFLVQTAAIVGTVWLVYSLWDAICDSLTERAGAYGRRTEKLLVPITRKLVGALILIGGVLGALASYGVNVTAVLTGLGVGGLVLALAAKDSVENIFGSFTILFDMPFALGDWVKIGNIEGSVEEINLRSTRLRTSEDSVITLPNSNLIRASVENLGARRHHRVKTIVAVPAKLPAETLEELVGRFRQVIREHPKTRRTGWQVELYEFTAAEAHILVNFFIDAATYSQELEYRGQILLELKRTAEALGIENMSAPAPETNAEEARVSESPSAVPQPPSPSTPTVD